ncbi:hypothetical protein C1924_05975 [Stenotrophomonas sp. ESTM1D_MKCIP4_1]|uniref:DUF6404 family protein n=1 Tax=Stenotrophomonas sp. ESTM1D_MKCIP4_1 TaxID=2072414 RepID=UPI000D542096|nr:DUF6404 family protein [Stenotrophomonas sp. ESTM1D_MKCIP4_1]AWH52752.1 hypothetical protein C1924_05975 [Stenotrophomonas sp. ESTM1D_MKCIP4_1]
MNPIDTRYPARIQAALRYLDQQRLPRAQAAPLLHRTLWRLGIALPPPIMAGFGTNALMQGLLFGLFWTGLMWVVLWQGSDRPWPLLLAAGLLAGALFGLVMAALMLSLRNSRKLLEWNRFVATLAD